ncbi:MAG: DNA polymerase III subunit alpha, partial [Clostridium sp.]
FTHFCRKADFSEVNKRAVESMIKAGAFDSFNIGRATLMSVYEKVIDGSVADKKNNIEGQMSLFQVGSSSKEEDMYKDDFKPMKEFTKRDLLSMEKEMIGLYISGHPMDDCTHLVDYYASDDISDIIQVTAEGEEDFDHKVEDGQKVKLGVVISSINIKTTRKNDVMAFIQVEDKYGSLEGVVFPKIYQKLSRYIYEDNIVLISGKMAVREDEAPKVLIDDISPMTAEAVHGKLFIRLYKESFKKDSEDIVPILRRHKGVSPVTIVLEDKENGTKTPLKSKEDIKVNITDLLIRDLSIIIGGENVKSVPYNSK